MTYSCPHCPNKTLQQIPSSDIFYKCPSCNIEFGLPCKFCNNLTKQYGSFSTYCILCHTTFYYHAEMKNNMLLATTELTSYIITHDQFELKFNLNDNQFTMFSWKENNDDLLKFNFLPDINPSNINEKLKTLLTFL